MSQLYDSSRHKMWKIFIVYKNDEYRNYNIVNDKYSGRD